MLDWLKTLDSLHPLAVITLQGWVIYLLVKGKAHFTRMGDRVEEIRHNDLHELPEMLNLLREIRTTLQRIEERQSGLIGLLQERAK